MRRREVLGGEPVMVVALLVVAAMVLLGLGALRWGADSRPGADAPPEGWIGRRC